MKHLTYLIVLLIFPLVSLSQNEKEKEKEELAKINLEFGQEHEKNEAHEFKHFRVAAALGHAYIPEAKSESGNFVVIPTFGLDIQYWFSHKWGIALKNDIEIADYLVESNNGNNNELVREYPIIVALPVLFSPWEGRGFNFILGPGIEFEEHENFHVLRMGVGSEFEIGNHWDFAPEIIYDLKDGHINSLTVAIGVGKRF